MKPSRKEILESISLISNQNSNEAFESELCLAHNLIRDIDDVSDLDDDELRLITGLMENGATILESCELGFSAKKVAAVVTALKTIGDDG